MFWESATFWLSAILAVAVPVAIWQGFNQRIENGQGVGWQFIRVLVIALGLPIIGVLALNNALTNEVTTLIAAAMGFAFGKPSGTSNKKSGDKGNA